MSFLLEALLLPFKVEVSHMQAAQHLCTQRLLLEHFYDHTYHLFWYGSDFHIVCREWRNLQNQLRSYFTSTVIGFPVVINLSKSCNEL